MLTIFCSRIPNLSSTQSETEVAQHHSPVRERSRSPLSLAQGGEEQFLMLTRRNTKSSPSPGSWENITNRKNREREIHLNLWQAGLPGRAEAADQASHDSWSYKWARPDVMPSPFCGSSGIRIHKSKISDRGEATSPPLAPEVRWEQSQHAPSSLALHRLSRESGASPPCTCGPARAEPAPSHWRSPRELGWCSLFLLLLKPSVVEEVHGRAG